MKFRRTLSLILILIVSGAVFFPSASNGAITEDLGTSLKAMSLGNAVTADPPGIYSIHFNPAGLTQLKQTHLQVSLMSPKFTFRQTFTAPENYNVFGFSDDPVKNRTSESSRINLYAPYLGAVTTPAGWPVPSGGGLAYRPPGTNLTFGTAVYIRAAAGYDRSHPNDPARFGGRQVGLTNLTYFSPSFGYEYSDSLSFGGSIGFSYMAFQANTNFRAPNPIVGLLRTVDEEICPALGDSGSVGLFIFGPACQDSLIGPFESVGTLDFALTDSVVPHYNLGVTWEPRDWLGFGAVYRSESEAQLAGEATIDYTDTFENVINNANEGPILRTIFATLNLPLSGTSEETRRVNFNLTFPQHIKLGTKIKPLYPIFPSLQLNVDWGWTDWDEWDTFNLRFNRTMDLLQIGRLLTGQGLRQLKLPRGYQSEDYWGVGLKFKPWQFTEVRLGFEDRESSIPKDKLDTLLALPDAQLYGFGMGYKWSRYTNFDFTVTHLRAESFVPANTSTNLNSTGIDNLIYNPYAGLDARLETTATIIGFTTNHRF